MSLSWTLPWKFRALTFPKCDCLTKLAWLYESCLSAKLHFGKNDPMCQIPIKSSLYVLCVFMQSRRWTLPFWTLHEFFFWCAMEKSHKLIFSLVLIPPIAHSLPPEQIWHISLIQWPDLDNSHIFMWYFDVTKYEIRHVLLAWERRNKACLINLFETHYLLSRTRYYWKRVLDKNFIFFITPLLYLRLSLVYCLVHPAYKKYNSLLLDECVCWSNSLKNRKKGGKIQRHKLKMSSDTLPVWTDLIYVLL